jgi:phage tail-like protein
MAQDRDFAMIHSVDQWRRVAHENTALQVEAGSVQLAWEIEERLDAAVGPQLPVAGLAFDPWCRLYRTLPEAGRMERIRWADPAAKQQEPFDLFESESQAAGEFVLAADDAMPLQDPRGLVIDGDGRLFVAESGAWRILIYDLVERRLLRRVGLEGVGRPLDLACDGRRVYALLDEPPGLAILDARTGPRFEALPAVVTAPSRIAAPAPGELYLLEAGGTESARILPLARVDEAIEVPFATDLEFLEQEVLVVARLPGQDFLRLRVATGAQEELPHLKARHYDGRGIVRTPDGRIGFWTGSGFAHATLARLRYIPEGRVTSFRLDSGEFQTHWGRVFIDACIPKGTQVRAHCLVMDEPPEDIELLERTPPDNTLSMTIHRPDLSPPMPPRVMVEDVVVTQDLQRRENGNELPWTCRPRDDAFETYEAPVIAAPGRYLWVVLELKGGARVTPRIRSLRVEYPAHDWLRRLPRIYSRDEAIADFLRRYLALFEGKLRDLDLRAANRHVLLDPKAAPAEVLPWLAGFIGLLLDERWPERARRELIENGIWLFRFRGTVMGVKRFLEIYLGRRITLVEHFKVRGLGGAIVGADDALTSNAIVGAGFRVGGRVGDEQAISINEQSIEDAFETHAHRFSVIVSASLSQEQHEVIAHILDEHRPAHTLYDLCSVDAGMRAGIGLYVELTTIVGRSAAFGRLQVGGSLIGRGAVLGRPGPGTRIGGSRLGSDSRVG